MSKQERKRKRSQEIPQIGNALEVPNYVTPMTDLEYKAVIDEALRVPPELAPGGLLPRDHLMR